jgi:hypothetical protein
MSVFLELGGISDFQESYRDDEGMSDFQPPRLIPCGWNEDDSSEREYSSHDYRYGYGIISRDRGQSDIQGGSAMGSDAPGIPGGTGGGVGSKRVNISDNESKPGNSNLALNKQRPSFNIVGMSGSMDDGNVQRGEMSGDTSPPVPSAPPITLGISRATAASPDRSSVGKEVRERKNSIAGINSGDSRVVEYQSRSLVFTDSNPKKGVEALPSYGTNSRSECASKSSEAVKTFHPDLESNPWI